MELDASSMEKRFAYKFLKKILKYVDSAQEFIAHLGKYHCDIPPQMCASLNILYSQKQCGIPLPRDDAFLL